MDDRTCEILNRFYTSWVQTKAHFDDLISCHEEFERLIPIRAFITHLEQAGGKEVYRLGTSIHMLIISRSVDHGLRTDQKYIRIEALSVNDFEVTMRAGEKMYRQYRVNDLKDSRVIKLFQTLKHVLID
jgi:hypothetical protein